jgi:8-oxo-dGTP pyrophosphatase MutT (NUDIX family)
MRISEAGLALFHRQGPAGTEYLTQWSDAWQSYSLIGGHVEPGESFRACCVREIAEELELTPDVDFRVAADPLRPLCEYTAMSKAAGVETRYRVELYAAELLTRAAEAKVNANAANRWLTEAEIRRHVCADGKEISIQVETVLERCDIIFAERPHSAGGNNP